MSVETKGGAAQWVKSEFKKMNNSSRSNRKGYLVSIYIYIYSR